MEVKMAGSRADVNNVVDNTAHNTAHNAAHNAAYDAAQNGAKRIDGSTESEPCSARVR